VQLSIHIHGDLALVAALGAPEERVSALGAMIAGLFGLHPFLCAHLAPLGNSPQHDLLANLEGEVGDMVAREIGALMATLISLLASTRFDKAGFAVTEWRVR
jgi:hypothetical protein